MHLRFSIGLKILPALPRSGAVNKQWMVVQGATPDPLYPVFAHLPATTLQQRRDAPIGRRRVHPVL
jgi:hypothetical protein